MISRPGFRSLAATLDPFRVAARGPLRSARRGALLATTALALLGTGSTGIASAETAEPPVGVAERPLELESVAPTAAADGILLAQDGGTSPRELEPAYRPPDPGPPGPYNERERRIYNPDYLFGLSRGLARSTIVPAAKAPLFILTVPLDIALLPFAAIGGFFG